MNDGTEDQRRLVQVTVAVRVFDENDDHVEQEPKALPRVDDAPRGEGPASRRDVDRMAVADVSSDTAEDF